ncbi:hypothetical protein KPZU09_19800 [Klebsiella pneumoniae]|uniref:Uncharacterized protein n=1 Tax=Klebsiella pneumoniae TaxID=573 RepID=A0A919LRX2_KLEPN|nr:hypothetical protein KPZU09_19800 [Klebsiella pneumoniae]
MQSIYYGTAETAASMLPRASWAYDNDAKITEYNPGSPRPPESPGAGKTDPQAVGAHQLAGVESQPAENGGAYPGGYGADWR